MRLRWLTIAALIGVPAFGQTPSWVVVEHAGYGPGYYQVFTVDGWPWITIYQPTDPNLGPYDFEVYDPNTPWPQEPRRVKGIDAVANAGAIDLMLRGHDGRAWGAEDVDNLLFNAEGVAATIKEFKISGTLGVEQPVYTGAIKGSMEVGAVGQDVHAGALEGDFTVIGDCAPGTTLEFGDVYGNITLDTPFAANLDIWGSSDYLSTITLAGQMTGSQINIYGSFYGEIYCNGDLGGYLDVAGEADDLYTQGVSGYLGLGSLLNGLQIEGPIALNGQVWIDTDASGGLTAGPVAGLLHVGGNCGGTVSLTAIAPPGHFTVGGNLGPGTLHLPYLRGELSVTGDLEAYIDVTEISATGTMTVSGNGHVPYLGIGWLYGNVTFTHDFSGYLYITTAMQGSVSIGGDALSLGYGEDQILILPRLEGSLTVSNELHIPLTVGGVATGRQLLLGSVWPVAGRAEPVLRIDGPVAGSVTVTGAVNAGASVTSVENAGTLDFGSIGANCAINTLAGNLLVHGDFAGNSFISVLDGDVLVQGGLTGNCTVGNFPAGASFTVDGTVQGSLFYATQAAGDTEIGGLSGSIEAGPYVGLFGPLSIHGSISGQGHVYFKGELLDSVDVDGSLGPQGTIQFDGGMGPGATLDIGTDLTGMVIFHQAIYGAIHVGNDLLGGLITNNEYFNAHLGGSITIDGDLAIGGIAIGGVLYDPQSPPISGGYIWIKGGFSNASIDVAGGLLGDTPFICVNYDAVGLESWDPTAYIYLPNESFNGNTPERHLWAVSPCRGDMNNDGTVDMADVNPFIEALQSPGPYAYSVDYPGLGGTAADDYQGGSRVWKGDANCDGTFDVLDINPFLALVYSGCCDSECPGCSFGGDGGMNGMMYEGGEGYPPGLPPPAELAAQLAANVWPELYDGLLAIVLATIDAAPDEGTQAYWQAVYAALTQ